MAGLTLLLLPILSIQLLLLATGGQSAATLTVLNKCDYTVWPGLFSANVNLCTTGFTLAKGELAVIPGPAGWSGRVWGRTLCSVDSTTNAFRCATGDCGTGTLECSGRNAVPPATLAEFKLDGDGGKDFFDVSLVDGFNLPVEIRPELVSGGDAGIGKCEVTDCPVDVKGRCPAELAVREQQSGQVVACKSACLAFGKDELCCTGAFGKPETCPPTSYSGIFKNACPKAYSYAYDDATSTFTCASGSTNYLVTFCPQGSSPGSGEQGHAPSAAPRIAPAWFY